MNTTSRTIILTALITSFSTALLVGGMNLLYAWSGPTSAPPNGNVAAPINVGTVDQIKNANLGINGLAVYGNTILAGTNSYLNFGSTAGTGGYGIRDNGGSLEFKNTGGSWANLNTSVRNLLTVNGISTDGLGNVSTIKFADGTSQATAGGGGLASCTKVITSQATIVMPATMNIGYTLIGGGGGAGGGGAVGSSGAIVAGNFSATSGNTITVTVGGGGGAGAVKVGGGAGGAGYFGGGGGASPFTTTTGASSGGGGGGSTAILNNGALVAFASGGAGGNGSVSATSGGGGGTSSGGSGGTAASPNVNGTSGSAGAGGAGAGGAGGAATPGGGYGVAGSGDAGGSAILTYQATSCSL